MKASHSKFSCFVITDLCTMIKKDEKNNTRDCINVAKNWVNCYKLCHTITFKNVLRLCDPLSVEKVE
jgi:hypothetical protein